MKNIVVDTDILIFLYGFHFILLTFNGFFCTSKVLAQPNKRPFPQSLGNRSSTICARRACLPIALVVVSEDEVLCPVCLKC